jgi:hypothetical protein
MIPLWTPRPIGAVFLPPYDEPYDPAVEAVLGGRNIGDPGIGRTSQRWTAAIEGSNIIVADEQGVIRWTTPAPGAQTVSLAFDATMAVVLAWTTATAGILYYYDSRIERHTTMTIPGATSVRVGVDDPRLVNEGNSDVLFFYTHSAMLHCRVQRERYEVDHIVGPSGDQLLVRAAWHSQYRFQVRLEKPQD